MNERTLFPLIDKLARCHQLTEAEYAQLIRFRTPETAARLAALARTAREAVYGTEVYTRGLIEVSNFCRNDCYYCGIRRSNQNCDRYRLSDEDILACCRPLPAPPRDGGPGPLRRPTPRRALL